MLRESSVAIGLWVDPCTHNGIGAGGFGLVYKRDKSCKAQLGGSTFSMSHRLGKSIMDLQTMGRVYY